MSATQVGTEKISVTTTNGGDNQRKVDAMRRMISRGQGRFVFALVEFDLPSLQNEVLLKLRESLVDLNIVTVKLSPPPLDAPRALTVLDQLEDLVKLHSPDKAPDALIITGYETLFADAIADESRPSYNLRRAIQPLNLGRNIFAEKFPCPVLLCLPPDAMGVFLRSAPDLVSWRSGYYKFESDLEAKRAELQQAAGAGTGWLTRWRMRIRKPEDLLDEIKRLESIIADAEALATDKILISRLYQRLGWTAVALRDRMQARWAFAQMLRLARAADDQRLIGAAVNGQRAADDVTPATRVSPQQAEVAQEVFRGAAALTEAEGLHGRESELRELISRVTFVGTRFLTVWGETGCGKTSLVLAGLLPELKRQGHYLPVVVRRWDELEATIRQGLEQTSGLPLESFSTLHDCVQHVAQQTQKTVVVICDQFEQFFTIHPQRGERTPLLKAIGECVNDLRISCRFIFIVREDHLGQMVEFELEKDAPVVEPLEQRKRFYLPLFDAADAARVLRQQANKARLDWPEVFVQTVASDLTQNGRVRPIEMQLVGAALAVSGISNELDYARVGRAQGLIVDYLQLTLDKLGQGKRSVQIMKRILLALVAEPAGRLALTEQEIARHIGTKYADVHRLLNPLTSAYLICQLNETPLDEQATNEPLACYELTHDVLVELVLDLTHDLQDKHQQASRVLTRAREDLTVNPRHTIGIDDCRLVRTHSDKSQLENPKVSPEDTLQLLLVALNNNDWVIRSAVASALGYVAFIDQSLIDQVVKSLPMVLTDKNPNVRRAAASTLGQIALFEPRLHGYVFQLLIVRDKAVHEGVRSHVAQLLFTMSMEEEKNGSDPVQFLFDHLEGRRSLVPSGDANTYAIYRDVVVGAMARLLVSSERGAVITQAALTQRLEQVRGKDKRLHLRVVARKVFAEADELREKQRRGEE